MKPLSEVSNYSIEPGDPDPRGYTVVAADGRQIGDVDDLIIDTQAMKVRYLVVDLEGASTSGRGSILLPVQDVDVSSGARQVIARTYSGNEATYARASSHGRSHSRDATEHDRTRLTRSEEELEIGKREVSGGEARIGKHVTTEHVSEPVTRRREEVIVERRPVEAGARADASISEDEIRVPLREEEVVVEKRPVVKEELVVGKRVVEERDTVEADVRREEFDIDNPTDTRTRTRGSRNDR
jgi:uncharacterized protein (TIGR02271 family)